MQQTQSLGQRFLTSNISTQSQSTKKFCRSTNPSFQPDNQAGIPTNLLLSSTGFDIIQCFVKIATRPNPKIEIGPVDLSCSFVVSEVTGDIPIIYCSPTFEELTGYSYSEIVGRNCRFLQHPFGQCQPGSNRSYCDHSIVQKIKVCTNEVEEGQFTIVNYRKNGEPFLNHLTIIPISFADDGKITHFVGLQIDLIRQPQAILKRLSNKTYAVNYRPVLAEPVVKEVEKTVDIVTEPCINIPQSMLAFIDAAPDLIFVLSLRGLFLHVSNSPILEYSINEVVGCKLSELVHPSDLVSTQRDLRDCSNTGSVNFICRFKRKVSGFIYIEVNARVYTGSKRNKCFIASGREVYIPKLEPSMFYQVANEGWVKVSERGLILYAFDCKSIFRLDDSQLNVHSIYDFLDPQSRDAVDVVLRGRNQSTSITATIQSKPYILAVIKERMCAWIQINLPGSLTCGVGNDVLGVLNCAKSSSLFYECNKLRVKNSKLEKEINGM